MPMTRDIAIQMALLAGDKSMKDAGRAAWRQPDYDAAAREFARLWVDGEVGFDD